MSKHRKNRDNNVNNHESQNYNTKDSLENIADSLGKIANEMKASAAEEKENKGLQKLSLWINLFNVIVTVFLTIIGINLSIFANSLEEKNKEPFFQLNITENRDDMVYQIRNTGGQIQSATIILRNYIDIFDRYYTQDHYYFPYSEVVQTFSEKDEDCFTIDFKDTNFGIDKWEDDGITNLLRNKLDDADLGTIISYFETMEIEYIDASRNVVIEYYIIKEDDSGELRLYLMPSEYQEEIQSLIPNGSDFKFRKNDVFCKRLGSTGRSGGRGANGFNTQFCQAVVEKLKEEISRKTNGNVSFSSVA